MKNLKKKGFTIVELVIVIAVIAVLAAVLIPTFVNLTKKANMSSDQVAVRNMNTLLATEFATEKPTEFRQVIDMLDKNGYNVDALTPLSKGYVFVWNQAENKIELVEISAAGEAPKLETGATFINENVSNAEELVSAINEGKDVTLTENIYLDNNIPISIKGNVTIDMNGKNFTSYLDPTNPQGSGSVNRPFVMTDGSTLTINAEGSEIECGRYGLVDLGTDTEKATLVLNGGNYIANTDNGSFIKARAGEINVTLNNVTYKDESNDGYVINLLNFAGNLTLNVIGGSYKAAYGFQLAGKIKLENASISTDYYSIYAGSDDITIKNCTFSLGNLVDPNQGVPAAALVVAESGTVNVEGCTVNGTAEYGMIVLNTGGTIIAKNNNISVNTKYALYNDLTEGSALIKVDGVEVVNKTK